MPELLLVESRLSLCGWVKTTLNQHGCKVTRVLDIQQAEWALRQCDFDLVFLASDTMLSCIADVQHVRRRSTLPLFALLPSLTETEHAALIQAGVDELICENTTRETLWTQTENWLSRVAHRPERQRY
ncbi:DNA-binding transcriptional response regulator [Enterovibrio calviensis]|uniref:response regulator transcription factor n=1 Tax=Enterovibrio calviensis TaxID=91359 RepID=UPI000485AA49|nr:response regulator transcription factor [Enterovibrio calviensis]